MIGARKSLQQHNVVVRVGIAAAAILFLRCQQHGFLTCHGFVIPPPQLLATTTLPSFCINGRFQTYYLDWKSRTTSPSACELRRRRGKIQLERRSKKAKSDDDDDDKDEPNENENNSILVRFWNRIQQKMFKNRISGARWKNRNLRYNSVDGNLGSLSAVDEKGDVLNGTTINAAGTTATTTTATATTSNTLQQTKGSSRWAMAAPSTNLSGEWKPIVTPAFRTKYDEYLQNCSEALIPRKLFTSLLHTTREVIDQNGRNFTITAKNPAGTWSRTLISSGMDISTTSSTGDNDNKPQEEQDYEVVLSEIIDPDKELVQVESWWEDSGTVHRSILRGKPRVRGGEFETLRYLEKKKGDDDDMLIVESFCHPCPDSKGFREGHVKWRFEREQT